MQRARELLGQHQLAGQTTPVEDMDDARRTAYWTHLHSTKKAFSVHDSIRNLAGSRIFNIAGQLVNIGPPRKSQNTLMVFHCHWPTSPDKSAMSERTQARSLCCVLWFLKGLACERSSESRTSCCELNW